MIPSINASKHAALLLRNQESKYKLQAFVSENFDKEPEIAKDFYNMAHDFHQVATFLEEQITLRTPKSEKTTETK